MELVEGGFEGLNGKGLFEMDVGFGYFGGLDNGIGEEGISWGWSILDYYFY